MDHREKRNYSERSGLNFPPTLHPTPPPSHTLTHSNTRTHTHSHTPLPSAFQSSYKEIKDERLWSENTSKGGGVTGSEKGGEQSGGSGPVIVQHPNL